VLQERAAHGQGEPDRHARPGAAAGALRCAAPRVCRGCCLIDWLACWLLACTVRCSLVLVTWSAALSHRLLAYPADPLLLTNLQPNLQIQMRDMPGFLETRQTLLELKSNNKHNWISFALAHHLSGHHEVAAKVLESYEGGWVTEWQDGLVLLIEVLLASCVCRASSLCTVIPGSLGCCCARSPPH
jgi:hypothetical protein